MSAKEPGDSPRYGGGKEPMLSHIPEVEEIFHSSRDVLEARRRELVILYPEMAGDDFELVANAQDAVAAANLLGYTHRILAEDARDIVLLKLLVAIEGNEVCSASNLHAFLANELHRNTLTVAASHLLADMHGALSRGIAADIAMLAKPAAGRPTNAERDKLIRRYIQAEEGMRELMRAAGKPSEWRNKNESYKEAGRIFDLSVKTIRNICSDTKAPDPGNG